MTKNDKILIDKVKSTGTKYLFVKCILCRPPPYLYQGVEFFGKIIEGKGGGKNGKELSICFSIWNGGRGCG